ncbi:MAG: BON domain-containing protein [Gemmataceae bacterium]
MTHLFRRYARLLCVAGGVSLAGWSLAATPGATPLTVSPSETKLQAMKAEVALLGDPATMRLPVAVLLEGDTVVLRGEVPDEPTRRRAVELARQSCYLPVRDGLNVARKSLVDPKALKKVARDTLVRSLGSKADRLVLTSTDDGQIKVEGEVASVEEKLHTSRTLREVPGCSRVINCLAVRGQGQQGNPITVVSSDGKGLVCTTKPEVAAPRPERPIQRVQYKADPPLPAPTTALLLPVPQPPTAAPPPAPKQPVPPPPAPKPQLVSQPPVPQLPPATPPNAILPSGLSQVPVVQAPTPPKGPPPAVVQVAPPPTTVPCDCSQGTASGHERPSMLDKLMAWKTARAARKQPPTYPMEVLMPAPPYRGPGTAGEEVTAAQTAKQPKPIKARVVETTPVSAPRVVPIPTPEPPPAPPEAPRQFAEAKPWPPAFRPSPVTPASVPASPAPANVTYVSRPLATLSSAPPPPPVPHVAPPAPPVRPVAQVPPPALPVAPPSVVQTSAPQPRVVAPEAPRAEPASSSPVMKVNVAEVPPIRLTENDLKKRLSDACGKLARDVRIELVPDGSVIVHIFAMPATEHLLMARLLHVHELGAKNVQLHVHLAN